MGREGVEQHLYQRGYLAQWSPSTSLDRITLEALVPAALHFAQPLQPGALPMASRTASMYQPAGGECRPAVKGEAVLPCFHGTIRVNGQPSPNFAMPRSWARLWREYLDDLSDKCAIPGIAAQEPAVIGRRGVHCRRVLMTGKAATAHVLAAWAAEALRESHCSNVIEGAVTALDVCGIGDGRSLSLATISSTGPAAGAASAAAAVKTSFGGAAAPSTDDSLTFAEAGEAMAAADAAAVVERAPVSSVEVRNVDAAAGILECSIEGSINEVITEGAVEGIIKGIVTEPAEETALAAVCTGADAAEAATEGAREVSNFAEVDLAMVEASMEISDLAACAAVAEAVTDAADASYAEGRSLGPTTTSFTGPAAGACCWSRRAVVQAALRGHPDAPCRHQRGTRKAPLYATEMRAMDARYVDHLRARSATARKDTSRQVRT